LLGTLAVVAVGALGAWCGWRLVKRFEGPAERTGFHMTDWSRVLGYNGGYVLLFFGLLTAVVGAPMYWISHSR
jgi:uncharacterized membrane protein YeaQ/YmgE (transglycosylase-associated protein family)